MIVTKALAIYNKRLQGNIIYRKYFDVYLEYCFSLFIFSRLYCNITMAMYFVNTENKIYLM